jgi:fluoroquinolone transport system permease protein
MKTLLTQLKWQFILLQKNKIISISLVLTFIYGALFYFMKDATNIDKALNFMILNDPSIIGYFFIALAVYTEIKHQLLPAIFTSPIKLHHYIISKTIALSTVGLVCSLILAFFVKGLDFDILNFSIGAMSICILTSLLALSVLTFASDFLKFAMLSIPIF